MNKQHNHLTRVYYNQRSNIIQKSWHHWPCTDMNRTLLVDIQMHTYIYGIRIGDIRITESHANEFCIIRSIFLSGETLSLHSNGTEQPCLKTLN